MGASRILVIGATGFIGSAVVRKLVEDGRSEVIAASRKPASRTSGAEAPESVACDMLDPRSVERACRGVDVVINCFRETTNERDAAAACANLLGACQANGVGKLIYISSIAVYPPADGEVEEDAATAGSPNWYGRAKRRAEMACEARSSPAFSVVVLRPSLVYGPGGVEWSMPFIESIAAGRLGDLGASGEGIANLVYVYDLAAFCVHLVQNPTPQFAIVNVNNPQPVTFNQYFREIAAGLGMAARRIDPKVTLPRRATAAGRRVARGLLRFAGPFATPSLRARFGSRPEDQARGGYMGRAFYSPRRAQQLGFEPKTTLRAGVLASIGWARTQGLVD